jgi:hypothetical protein
LQNPSHLTGDYADKLKHETSRAFRNNKENIVKPKLMSNKKYNLYRGMNKLNKIIKVYILCLLAAVFRQNEL